MLQHGPQSVSGASSWEEKATVVLLAAGHSHHTRYIINKKAAPLGLGGVPLGHATPGRPIAGMINVPMLGSVTFLLCFQLAT